MCILLNFYHACVRCPVLHSGLSVCVHACFFKLALGKRYRDSFLYFIFLGCSEFGCQCWCSQLPGKARL